MAIESTIVSLFITHAESELTALPDHGWTVCLPRPCRRAGHIRREKSEICGFCQVHYCTGKDISMTVTLYS